MMTLACPNCFFEHDACLLIFDAENSRGNYPGWQAEWQRIGASG